MKTPIHESQVKEQVWYLGTDREIRGKALSDVGGKAKIGFGLMELPVGSNTKPGHWHSMEEEHLFALSGVATLHLGAESFTLSNGSYVCFPAGQAVPHHLSNSGSEPFVYIIVGERIPGDEVTYPPTAA
jgi:uncharacterized cupin superfamily protein